MTPGAAITLETAASDRSEVIRGIVGHRQLLVWWNH